MSKDCWETPDDLFNKWDAAYHFVLDAAANDAKELGLVPFVRWSGENDRHVKRWDAPDQYTLDAAAALVGRMK